MKLSYGSWFDVLTWWGNRGWRIGSGKIISRGRGWCYDPSGHLGAWDDHNEPGSFSDYRGFRSVMKVE